MFTTITTILGLVIQISGLVIQGTIAIILAISGFLIFQQLRIQIRLAKTQIRLAKTQIVHGRFEMYVKTNEPVTDEHVRELKLYPADHMDIKLYESKYKNDDKAIRKYIYMNVLYEYLAFTHSMPRAKFLNEHFVKMWVKDLLQESEFREVHEYCNGKKHEYYPPFAAVVEEVKKEMQMENNGNSPFFDRP